MPGHGLGKFCDMRKDVAHQHRQRVRTKGDVRRFTPGHGLGDFVLCSRIITVAPNPLQVSIDDQNPSMIRRIW